MLIRPARGRTLDSVDVVIIQPVAGHAVLVNNYVTGTQSGVIRVQIQKPNLSHAVRYIGKIANVGDVVSWPPTLPANPPPGFFELTSTDGGVHFSNDNCAVTSLPAGSPTGNNKVVNVKGYDGGGQPVTADAAAFVAVPATYNVTVDARCCLWLAYAPGGLTLAFHETTTPPSPYLPILLLVPDAPATMVHLRAPMGQWDHGGPASDADGNGILRPLERPDIYKNDLRLNSANITGSVPLPLNKLVGMWSFGGPQNPTAEMAVGKTADLMIPTAPARPDVLYLAFHDGYEWSNNHGAIQVQVSWS